jgi:surface antigen
MTFKQLVLAVAATSMLAACTNQGMYSSGGTRSGSVDPVFNKRNAGGLLGAVGGAVLGSNVGKGKGNIAAIAVGTLLGAGLGSSVGESLDKADLNYYENTAQTALETAPAGQTLPWSNPQSGNSGTITPKQYYQSSNGQYCREYTQSINVGGRIQEGVGTACRQPDGSWRIVE